MGSGAFPRKEFLSLCMPAFNEEGSIADTLDAALAILPELMSRFEIIVVNDGSTDRTAEIVRLYARQDDRVRLVQHETNRGYGAAVSSGLRAAAGDLVAFTDSDGQFSLLDLPQLLLRIEDKDVAIGYRYRRADNSLRRFNAWAWNRLVGLLLGIHVQDLDCAFKLFRREVVERLCLTATGACISAEIMVQCTRAGLRIGEVPVTHYPRYQGVPSGAAIKVIWRSVSRTTQPLALPTHRASCTSAVPQLERQGRQWTGYKGDPFERRPRIRDRDTRDFAYNLRAPPCC